MKHAEIFGRPRQGNPELLAKAIQTVMTHAEILAWLKEENAERLSELYREADAVRRLHVGDAVHLRGLIEISNYCSRQCHYCGLRAGNSSLGRYRMKPAEIVACAVQAVEFGYGTVVLQSGEDWGIAAGELADVIREIKSRTPLAVTLSLGERKAEEFALWRAAGADRYLLRFETSNAELYGRIHPQHQGPGTRDQGLGKTAGNGQQAEAGEFEGRSSKFEARQTTNSTLASATGSIETAGNRREHGGPGTRDRGLGKETTTARNGTLASATGSITAETATTNTAMPAGETPTGRKGKMPSPLSPDTPPPLTPASLRDRFAILRELREIGYEIGSGVMIGIPGQSYDDLARDVEMFGELDLEMIGVGPFLPHPQTPLGDGADRRLPAQQQVPNTEAMTYKMLALTRLACPDANIPATTALATINKASGREQGLVRGANIVMPNMTPLEYRAMYEIYPGKACIGETARECQGCLRKRIESIGRFVGSGRGDSPRRVARQRQVR